jgi:hypothetical protein
MESTFDYLRAHAVELGSRILETYPPLQSTKDPVDPRIATLLRKALPAQALAITGPPSISAGPRPRGSSPNVEPVTRRVSYAVRQVPDEYDGIPFARRHL